MSNLTANEVNGLMEAYTAVYDPDLREQLEEEKELEKEILENIAYVLFSKGYNAINVLEYFTYTDQEVIIEDVISLTEGTLLFETVVSEQYIDEQFENLNEFVGAALRVGKAALQAAKHAPKGSGPLARIGSALTGAGKATTRVAAQGPKASAVVRPAISKAVSGLKSAAPAALKGAAGGAGKLLGKALPGAGAVLYGMDAVDRAKKGDWGGAALSGIGAATSFGGPLAALAPAGIQMATDALGWTGDKSKKSGAPKSEPGKSPSLKARQAYAKSKGKYYSSSDQKTYKNYNDALAARNSRRGIKPAAPASAAPAAPSGSGGGGGSSPSPAPKSSTPAKPSDTADSKLTDMPKANSRLAEVERLRQSGAPRSEINKVMYNKGTAAYNDAISDKPGPGEKQDQTPTTGPEATEAQKSEAGKDVMAQLEREQEKMKRKQKEDKIKNDTSTTTSENYDAYDIILNYLFENGHVDTLDEAHYVMMEMDVETVGSICEAIKN